MAIVVESVSARGTASNTSTVVVAKPTGLAVGDLMIAMLGSVAGDSSQSAVSFNTASGWTLVLTQQRSSLGLVMAMQYKIATAGDVSASNFTFTTNANGDLLLGQLIRASGQNTLNPLGLSDGYNPTGSNQNSATVTRTISSYTPGTDGALFVMMIGSEWDSGGTARSVSGYTTTTSGITFTEGFDDYSTDGGGGMSLSGAYGVQSTNAEITQYRATLSATTARHAAILAIFIPPVDATGSNTLTTTTSTTFAQAGTADTIASNILTTATGVANTQTGKGTTPTQWTNESKPSTSWTNETL